jgi:serine/threonine protein phosphatase PrpC
LVIAHIGDSRAYLIRSGRAWPLTRDHTWVADALARGLLTPQEAVQHPWRHVLTRNLGSQSATVDVRRVACAPGDRLILCSDGVSDLLAPQEIAWLGSRSPRDAARAMVATVRRRGGKDDASAIVVALGRPARQPRPVARIHAQQWRHRTAAASSLSVETVQLLLISGSIVVAGLATIAWMMLLTSGG